jgi:uncharacterized protein YjdB
MRDLAVKSSNQFYAMHVATGKVEFLKLGPGNITASLRAENQSKVAAA